MNDGLRRFLTLLLVFVTAFGAVYAYRASKEGRGLFGFFESDDRPVETYPQSFTLPDLPALEIDDVQLLMRLNQEYAKLTRAVIPSVVSIDTAGVRTERQFDVWGRARLRRIPVQDQGSGAIVTEEGHVVTNHHVIENKERLQVTMHDGKSYPAVLVGEDRILDIAVLKIQAEGPFQPLKFGDSDHAQVGEMVFAVGNPFGLGETVTQGILSARDRSLSDTQRDLFQTDAAINPGNSGGPLVNLRGEIIGINVAIFTPGGQQPSQGVGFSIPANDVKDSLVAILQRGRPVRGYLGVGMEDLTTAWRKELGYRRADGAVVAMVAPDSPAEAAGLRLNDVVLSYNGEQIRGTRHLLRLVQQTKGGTRVSLGVWRAGKEETLETVIGEANDAANVEPQESAAVPAAPGERAMKALGLEVRDLSAEERRQGFRGVVVSEVHPDGAASAGAQRGDLVFLANGEVVSDAEEFLRILGASAAVRPTVLVVRRGTQNLRIALPPVP